MTTPSITAFEHQPIPVGDAEKGLTTAEADYLALLSETRPGFCDRGHQSVRLAQYCGVVSLGARILEVLPKVDDGSGQDECRGVLLRLLRQADDFPLFRHLTVGQNLRHAPLLDVFIAAFFDAVTDIVRGGLLRQYQQHDDDLRFVRGRIVSTRQFVQLANRGDIVACRFDELTADNMWNRLIKTALRAVRPWIGSHELDRRWVELIAVFEEVSDLETDPMALGRLVFDRHASRYRTAIDWVRWILATLSPSLRAGQNTSPGLLFDMNKLFESAVASLLRRRAGWQGVDVEVSSQDTGRHFARISDEGQWRMFRLRPDLVLRRDGRVTSIGDAKWKRLNVGQGNYLVPSEADLYQMHAYAAAFQCEHLSLIYPWHDGLRAARDTAFELPSNGALRPVVSVLCLDVHADTLVLRRGGGASGFGPVFQSTLMRRVDRASA
jgi:5-methylcytosine-specific restriction enzyme subunit McrC